MEIKIKGKEKEKVNEQSLHKIVSYAILLGFEVSIINLSAVEKWMENYAEAGKLKIKKTTKI
ncbi:hypothetical protein [Bacteroides sp.]|uniref:hypothetical protein n=1 Tax=Bacteroides sp. TaxID=29523 RepID=UPI002632D4E4|nr:hypothetical protein [Bacteroides sp.]MDD3040405.1 hypothetical protein [Bacteroides sp.]